MKRIFDLLPHQQKNFPQKVAFAHKRGGKWETWSTDEALEIIDKVSLAFQALGFKKGDKVGIISSNRPEWNFTDMGMMRLGIISVPIYPTISEDDYRFIFNHAELKGVFVEDETLLDKITNIKADISTLEHIFSYNTLSGCADFETFLAKGNGEKIADVEISSASINQDYLASIIYTSGTTGTPKGVMLSHDSIMKNINAVLPIIPIGLGNRGLSFLPLCHILERTVTCGYMAAGVNIYYAESIEKLGENIQEVNPHFFSAVPRLLEKVYDKIQAKGAALTGIQKLIFDFSISEGLKYDFQKKPNWKLRLLNKTIFKKWREALGGNIRGIVVGGAACPPHLIKLFNAAGINVREGYGQTEMPIITFNRFESEGIREATVGLPMPEMEIRIDSNSNEILVRANNKMMGYYKRQDLTDEAIDAEGWLHTGDTGTFVEGRFLKITGRIKELFKTSGGKYVAPTMIEDKMKASPFIEQMMVVGEGERFVAALIVPSFESVRSHFEAQGESFGDNKELANSDQVQTLVNKEVERYNQELGKIEKIKKYKILTNEWTTETGELTATLKMKRRVIAEKNSPAIAELYN